MDQRPEPKPETTQEAFLRGRRTAYLDMIRQGMKGLGVDGISDEEWTLWGKKKQEINLMIEREEAIATLKRICEEYGDLDWTPDLHLADIIGNHLGKHLPGSLSRIET